MAKKVLIISGSPRKGGNSDILCDEFMRGAKESGNDVEKVFLGDMEVGFCKACYACTKHGRCIIKDDVPGIIDKIEGADVIVMASPVYFYSIDAQLKALIDRTVSRWTIIADKKFYYIVTSAEDTDTVADCTIECMRGLAACLGGSVEAGVILGRGVCEAGEIRDHPDIMAQAYDMGKSC